VSLCVQCRHSWRRETANATHWTSALDGVSDQPHGPVALLPGGKEPAVPNEYRVGGGGTASLYALKGRKSCHCGENLYKLILLTGLQKVVWKFLLHWNCNSRIVYDSRCVVGFRKLFFSFVAREIWNVKLWKTIHTEGFATRKYREHVEIRVLMYS